MATILEINFDKPVLLWGSIIVNTMETPTISYSLTNEEISIIRAWLNSSAVPLKAINDTLQCIAEDDQGNELLHMWFDDFPNSNPFSSSFDESVEVNETITLLEKLSNLTMSWKEQIGINSLSFEFYRQETNKDLDNRKITFQHHESVYKMSIHTFDIWLEEQLSRHYTDEEQFIYKIDGLELTSHLTNGLVTDEPVDFNFSNQTVGQVVSKLTKWIEDNSFNTKGYFFQFLNQRLN